MEIKLHEISIREIINGYVDSAEEGVLAYGKRLNLRPPFQREFCYDDKKRYAVINSVMKGFPLNVMYWIEKDDGTYEMLDGQQRTVSICQYADNVFSFENKAFHNLPSDIRDKFLDYKLLIYFCKGTVSETLDWFQTINTAGDKLTDQELRNALFTGTWLLDAKRHFSKTGCAGYNLGKDYVSGEPIRQTFLETVLKWIVDYQGLSSIKEYMSKHQHDANCNELWMYYTTVINWIKMLFFNVRREMKGLPWGIFWNKYHDKNYDATILEGRIKELMADDEVTSKKGIYEYLLSCDSTGYNGDEKYLSLRAFTDSQKTSAYHKQNGICPLCGKHYDYKDMQGDHKIPWSKGGKTEPNNLQMLCWSCNLKKSCH